MVKTSSPLPDQDVEVQRHLPIRGIERPWLNGRSTRHLRLTAKTLFQPLTGLIAILAAVFIVVTCFRKSRIQGRGASQRWLAKEEEDGPESKREQRDLCQARNPDVVDEERGPSPQEDGVAADGEDVEDLYAMPPTTFYDDPETLRLSTPHRPRKKKLPGFIPLGYILPRGEEGPQPTYKGETEVLEEPRDPEGGSSSIGAARYEAVLRRARQASERSVKSLDVLTLLLREGYDALLASEAKALQSESVARYVGTLTQSLEAQAEVALLACERWAPLLSPESVLEWEGAIVTARNLLSRVRGTFEFRFASPETVEPMGGMTLECLMIFRMQYVHSESLALLENLFFEGPQVAAAFAGQLTSARELLSWFNRYRRLGAFEQGTYANAHLRARERKLSGMVKTLEAISSAYKMWGCDPKAAPLQAVETHTRALVALLAIHKEIPDQFIAEGIVPWWEELKRVVDILRERPRGRRAWRSLARHFFTFYVLPCLNPDEYSLPRALLVAEDVIKRVQRTLKGRGVRVNRG
ncbi:hypothetical protein ACSSS7_000936 [Eimeria intestinalis]